MLKDLLRQYWPNIAALAVFTVAIARFIHLGRWEHNVGYIAIAALGFLSVIASDEVAELTGHYGWTRQQWWQYPSTLVKVLGGFVLIVSTIVLYRI